MHSTSYAAIGKTFEPVLVMPYVCPVCKGKGLVLQGFYSPWGPLPVAGNTDPAQESCRSCIGSGVVWR
jgi:hypothetical protein